MYHLPPNNNLGPLFANQGYPPADQRRFQLSQPDRDLYARTNNNQPEGEGMVYGWGARGRARGK